VILKELGVNIVILKIVKYVIYHLKKLEKIWSIITSQDISDLLLVRDAMVI
tara:strand:- start:2607 stop:2759 length:153 start_codon:yes stop_codon:yes gene_type:complete